MAKNKIGAPALSRTMTAGQMEMISLGGAIGVGLFMGSTASIKWTGPSVLLAYAFVGLLLYIVMRSLGEMIYLNPGTGSFADYATEYVHPLAGYLAKWANVFEYIVVPRHPGVYKIDAFSYSFFNPSTGKYEEKDIPEIVLNVEAGKNATMNPNSSPGSKRTGGDIEYIKPTVDKWHAIGKNFLFSAAFWSCMGAEILLFGLCLLFFRLHAKIKADLAGLKNRKAAKEAKRCLKKAAFLLKEGKREDFFIEISQALWGFLSNKFNIPPANLSMDTVRDELGKRQVADDLSTQFIQTLDHCEFERFSPQASRVEGMKKMYEEAYAIIYKITGAIK